jgi:hypothetical protein
MYMNSNTRWNTIKKSLKDQKMVIWFLFFAISFL